MATPARGRTELEPAEMQRLLEALARGEEAALDRLMDLLWDRLVRYAARLLGSASAADDVVQTAFVRLWAGREGLRASGSVTGFLYRTTRNLVLDERRRVRVRRLWAAREARTDPPRRATPLEEAEAGETRRAIRRALEGLPPRRREIVELARFHDLTYREIAEVMGISPQTVANQMSAALAQLRVVLGRYGEGPNARS